MLDECNFRSKQDEKNRINKLNGGLCSLIHVMFNAYFSYRKSKHGYGAITSNDDVSCPDPNLAETIAGNSGTTTTTSSPTATTGVPPGTSRKVVKKQSVVYCMHGNVPGEDCCDNGGTTVNIKQIDSK